MESRALSVLFEDDYFLAIDKPAGMLVHRTKLDARERIFAVQMLRDQIGRHVFPVHRLDKPTSGVLLFGKDRTSARAFSQLLQSGYVTKRYEAVLRGWTVLEETIDYPLKERLDKTTDSKARADKPAQDAVSWYKRIGIAEIHSPVGRYQTARYSLVKIVPETGRKHQLRRHFKHIFHPIIGDRKYGDRDHNAFFKTNLGISRLLLAATELSFKHPFLDSDVQISTPSAFPVEIMKHFQEAEVLSNLE